MACAKTAHSGSLAQSEHNSNVGPLIYVALVRVAILLLVCKSHFRKLAF